MAEHKPPSFIGDKYIRLVFKDGGEVEEEVIGMTDQSCHQATQGIEAGLGPRATTSESTLVRQKQKEKED